MSSIGERIKKLRKIYQKIDNIEIQKKLLDLSKQALEMQNEILKLIAPGTQLRAGLDNILKAKTGALIIIGDSKEVLDLVDGGFRIDEEYTPARL